jgi:hypothetical protein
MGSKTIIAVTFLCAGLAQVNAKDTSRSKEGPPPRPLFSAIDINGDRDIDFVEFSSTKVPREGHQHIFSQIDQDNNGVISKTEFMNHKPPKKKEKNND